MSEYVHLSLDERFAIARLQEREGLHLEVQAVREAADAPQ
jgi:hypothetical protein